MSYSIKVTDCNFFIAGKDRVPMVKAINEYLRNDVETKLRVDTLKEYLQEYLGVSDLEVIKNNETGDIVGLSFEDTHIDETSLYPIAPFVADGSYMEFRGEEGDVFRWVFTDNTVKYVSPKITWSDGKIKVLDSCLNLPISQIRDVIKNIKEFAADLKSADESASLTVINRLSQVQTLEDYFQAIGGDNIVVNYDDTAMVVKDVYFTASETIRETWMWALAPFMESGYIHFFDSETKEQYRYVFFEQDVLEEKLSMHGRFV